MSKFASSSALTTSAKVFTKDTLEKGQPSKIQCTEIDGQTFSLSPGPVKVVHLEDEWFEDLKNPESVIQTLQKDNPLNADLFTFWQRIPYYEPQYSYYQEWEDIAVLEVVSYEDWWNNQIKSRVRNLIRKAEKSGIRIEETAFDDDFVHGMTAIFNESPIRQGRRFWHYGKDFATVKEQFSRYLFREHMIGAYYEDEMIGFMMVGNAGRFGLTGQIISSLKHRNKATNNALIAKAVELCANLELGYFSYLFWSEDSLAEFKRRCGFERKRVPRYYIPLTAKGKLALKIGAHRGLKNMLPQSVVGPLKQLRKKWNERQ